MEQGGTTPITWSPAKVEGARHHMFCVVLMSVSQCDVVITECGCGYYIGGVAIL